MLGRGLDPQRGGLSELSRKSGVSASTLSRVIREGRIPEIDALRRIGLFFGVSLGDMLIISGLAEPAELPPGPDVPSIGPPDSPEQAIMSDPGLDPVTKAALLGALSAARNAQRQSGESADRRRKNAS